MPLRAPKPVTKTGAERLTHHTSRRLAATTLALAVGLGAGVGMGFVPVGPLPVSAALAQSTDQAPAPTVETIRNDILSGLAAPLPITVLGPLIVQNVDVTKAEGGFQVELQSPLLMGIVPLEAISFTLTPEGDKLRVSDFSLPASVPLFGAAVLEIGSSEVSGLWSPSDRSYADLQFTLGGLQVRTLGGQSMQVDIGQLSLAVDQQGTLRADGTTAQDSVLRIETADVRTQGLPENDVMLDALFAELKANGEEPVDLYAIVSRFVLLSAMQGDQSAAMRFFDSLRAQDYALLSLELGGRGLAVTQTGGQQGTLTVAGLGASLGLEDATPEAWRQASLVIEGRGIEDMGFSDRLNTNVVQSASTTLRGTEIPIARIIEAVELVMAADAGAQVDIDLGGLLDGLIGFDTLSLETAATDISITSRRQNGEELELGSYGGEIRLEGLGADGSGEGLLGFAQRAENIELNLPPQADPTAARIQEVLLPRAFNYDVAMDGLQLPLLRQVSEGTIIPAGAEPVEVVAPLGLWFTALAPNIRVTDTFFDGEGFGFYSESDVTFYPSWILAFPPYEGTARTELRGTDNLRELIELGLDTPQPGPDAEPRARREWREQQQALRLGLSVLNVFTAIAATDGEGEDRVDIWDMNIPDARGEIVEINGIELRIPNLFGMLPVTMGAAFR
ncbi:MAG: hypothetical protein AAF737_09180 [Pseudomonadota bacterium]